MTDKQIIDGVDVSGCSYGEIEKAIFKCSCEYNVRSASMFCKDNPNCYYKQLKQKEQECNELKKELQAQRDFTAHEQKLIYCVAYDETCKTDNDCKQKKCIFKDNIKLKKTLTEIKKIALGVRNYLNCSSPRDVRYEMDIILQKISECEVENE